MEEVKKDLLLVAQNLREGRRNRCPMGILFTGPMGTGKTFVAEAFAKECGLTTIKLKNFRSEVGRRHGRQPRTHPLRHPRDRADHRDHRRGRSRVRRQRGRWATGERPRASSPGIKEFMSDTENRGRVLFLLMTNRPDKLDVDIKRAGSVRPEDPVPLSAVRRRRSSASSRRSSSKHKVKNDARVSTRPRASLRTPRGLLERRPRSGRDARQRLRGSTKPAPTACEGKDTPVGIAELDRAVVDYMPARDVVMLEFMELLAVFEASNRRMLPKKYAELTADELQVRMNTLRAQIGTRR